MGGHQSTQTVQVSTKIVSNAIQQATQDCISYVNSSNLIDISGNNNRIDGTSQALTVSVNSNCVARTTQAAEFSNKLAENVSQAIKEQSIAMTQWADGSKSENNNILNQSIETNISASTVQKCLNDINTQNILRVSGSGNTIKNATQSNTVSIISQCLLGQEQSSKVINDITNTVNQQSEIKSVNAFAFIADAITSIFGSMFKFGNMIIIAIVFIVIISFIFIFMKLIHGKKKPANTNTSTNTNTNTNANT